MKRVFLKLSQNFLKKTYACVSFLIKVAGWRLETRYLFEKKLLHRCLPMNFAYFLRTPIWPNKYEWLLMKSEILKDRLIRFTKENVYLKTSIQNDVPRKIVLPRLSESILILTKSQEFMVCTHYDIKACYKVIVWKVFCRVK